nr:MAG TPA: hypothetical protein [Caudoviricetes sp.]
MSLLATLTFTIMFLMNIIGRLNNGRRCQGVSRL